MEQISFFFLSLSPHINWISVQLENNSITHSRTTHTPKLKEKQYNTPKTHLNKYTYTQTTGGNRESKD